MTDGATIAIFINIPTRFDDLADEAIVNQFHVSDQRRVGTVLRSMLHDAPVLVGSGGDLSTFVGAVWQWKPMVHMPMRLLAPKTLPCARAPATMTAVAVLPRNCRRVSWI